MEEKHSDVLVLNASAHIERTGRCNYNGIQDAYRRARNNEKVKRFITVPAGGIPLCKDYADLETEYLNKLREEYCK